MPKSKHILVIANDDTTRNLLEQFFITRDMKVVATRTFPSAENAIDSWGLEPFNLAIIDTAAFGLGELEQKYMACHMLREWSMQYPSLPVLFLGTTSQKRAMLKIRADMIHIVIKPFDLDIFVETINRLYPGLHPAALNIPY